MIRILTDDLAADTIRQRGRDSWSSAAAEALAVLGVPASICDVRDWTPSDDGWPVLVVDEPAPAVAGALLAWAESGGLLLVCGCHPGWAGFDADPATEDHIVVDAQLTSDGVPRRLRTFGGWELTGDWELAAGSDDVLVDAVWPGSGRPAIVRRRLGRGTVAVVGPDVWHSLVRITQGWPVTADGTPPDDGSAPVDDDTLKTDDGIALSYLHDRTAIAGSPDTVFEHAYPPAASVPFFGTAHADLWRETILHLLLDLAAQSGQVLPLVYYWPDAAPAVAHVSHDSDANDDDSARAALSCFDDLDLAVTWCFLYPGGYSQAIYDEVIAAGHEPALHYNAMPDGPGCEWGFEQLRDQLAWAVEQTRGARIVTNKNHFTRWEGWDDFFLWCEELGLLVDQSHGPSVQGNIGFPFGTCHPHFPLARKELGNRRIDVLSMPLQTQDLWLTCTLEVRDAFVAEVVRRHGLAHFLFHGQHIQLLPQVRAALVETVTRLRALDVPFYTSAELAEWETARRQLRVRTHAVDATPCTDATATTDITAATDITVGSDRDVAGVTLLFAVPPGLAVPQVRSAEDDLHCDQVVRHGRDFVQVVLDIPAGGRSIRLTLEPPAGAG